MKTLGRHLLIQTLATLVVCVGVFYLLLLLGNVLRDILDLLATRSASPAGEGSLRMVNTNGITTTTHTAVRGT